jgi:hypothetical protein
MLRHREQENTNLNPPNGSHGSSERKKHHNSFTIKRCSSLFSFYSSFLYVCLLLTRRFKSFKANRNHLCDESLLDRKADGSHFFPQLVRRLLRISYADYTNFSRKKRELKALRRTKLNDLDSYFEEEEKKNAWYHLLICFCRRDPKEG